MEEKIFTQEELSKYWGISYNTVNILLRRGELAGFKICGTWRIPLSAVKKYEEEHTARPNISKLEELRRKTANGTMRLVKDAKGRVKLVNDA